MLNLDLNSTELKIILASLEQYYNHEPVTEVDDLYEKLKNKLYETKY